ncbi:hypothetical protein C2G38_721599 [Gigaspora rosea]|uniref:Uncharacterized protein n=1 Tax=Gigaspora rosea TaxID=44941 RepID=A0A397VS40_9GLOM|nr:hypothetical protein C2G38_721599 [Gigaspora rosea]
MGERIELKIIYRSYIGWLSFFTEPLCILSCLSYLLQYYAVTFHVNYLRIYRIDVFLNFICFKEPLLFVINNELDTCWLKHDFFFTEHSIMP